MVAINAFGDSPSSRPNWDAHTDKQHRNVVPPAALPGVET